MNTISWAKPLPMQRNPLAVFERLFGDGSTPEQRLARRQEDRSILDSITHEVASLGKVIGHVDRVRLDEYLDEIRAIERRLQATTKATGDLPLADGATALHWAARWNDLDMAELLILTGADINAVNRLDVSPLALACINGSAAMIAKLLDAGVDPNAPLSGVEETPLMMAARTGNPAAVKVLLDHGANVNEKETSRGQTALMWAASERNPAVVKMLIDHGADVNATSTIETIVGRGLYGRGAAPPALPHREVRRIRRSRMRSPNLILTRSSLCC